MNHVLIKIKRNVIVLICLLLGFTQLAFAQNVQIRGKITDEAGEAIIGASVYQKGTSNAMPTDVNGDFTLNVPGNATLVISIMGYISKEVRVNNQSYLTIQLAEDANLLDEVIVTGYSVQRKVDLTGAISSVTSKEIAATKNENLVNMLTGKLPGVRINQRSAQPGAYDVSIDIRGMGTPLYVINGVVRDYNYFARMDPDEIESVSVLKDGAAAIYGARAANGVFLVTTKRGTSQQGRVDITYSGSYTAQSMLYMPKSVTAVQYYELREEYDAQDFGKHYLIRQPSPYRDDKQPYLNGKPDYDWMSTVLRDISPQQKHNLSINGGSDQLAYFFNVGYREQQSQLKSNDFYERMYNFRTSVDAKFTRNLSAQVELAGQLGDTYGTNGYDWSFYKNVWLQSPVAAVYANDNPLYYNGDRDKLFDGRNMLAESRAKDKGYTLSKRRNLDGSLALTYDVPGIKGLSAQVRYNYMLVLPESTNLRKTYNLYVYDGPTDTYIASPKQSPAGITRTYNPSYNTDMQLRLSYRNQFGNHNINALLLFNETYSNSAGSFSAYRDLLVNSEYLFAGERNGNTDGSGGTPSDRVTQGFVGTASYGYSSKYLLDFRFRYDASSRFPAGSRWGFFPSLSLGWRISEESFIKNNIEFLSNMKLRASYGEMGDDNNANNYPSIFTGYNLDGSNYGWYYNGVMTGGVNPASIGNPNLTWYKARSYNVGLDVGLFNNKLRGTVEAFKRDRSGILASSSAVVPGTVGANLPQENMNSDRVMGYEIDIQHSNRVDKVNYNISANLSGTRSMNLYQLETAANNSFHHWGNRSAYRYTSRTSSTQSGGMFKTYDEIRSFTDYVLGQGALPGDWWRVDWNGDGVIDGNDNHPMTTSGIPKFYYGFLTDVSWKNFDFTMNFQGAFGVWVSYGEVLTNPFAYGGNENKLSWFMDRWHPEDPSADYFNPNTKWIEGYYPVSGHDGRRTGSNNNMNGSYLRLKTLDIGYTVPKTILAKVGVKSLRVYLSGYNLLTWTPLRNVDPERPGGGASDFYAYPVDRTYTVGLNIKF